MKKIQRKIIKLEEEIALKQKRMPQELLKWEGKKLFIMMNHFATVSKIILSAFEV